MTDPLPEVLWSSCSRCESFKNNGLQDGGSGQCSFYSMQRYHSYICLGSELLISRGKFNWGGFFLSPLWLLFNASVIWGILLIALHVLARILPIATPLGLVFNLIMLAVSLAVSIYLGFCGNEVVQARKKYRTVQDVTRDQRGWNLAGKIVAVLEAITLTIVVIVTLIHFMQRF